MVCGKKPAASCKKMKWSFISHFKCVCGLHGAHKCIEVCLHLTVGAICFLHVRQSREVNVGPRT